MLKQNDDQDDFFGGSDSKEEGHVSECSDKDYEDEKADSELESKLENASLQQRSIGTRENRRASRPVSRIRGTNQSQLTHVSY